MIASMTPAELWHTLKTFPWRGTGRTLLERFREDRLGNTASSLTFTTLISLVPLFAVVLAIFTAFPVFGKLQGSLQGWLAASLIPEPIAKQVMGYLTQFASKASRLGLVGLVTLLVTALSLVLTIDRTLNGIWRVRRRRPLAQRVLVYWAVLTLGPLVLAGSIAFTSYAVTASRGLVSSLPVALKLLLDALEFSIIVGGVAALFRYVPNTEVRWREAITGGLFVALGAELAKAGMVAYLKAVPSYSAIYGAFASVPILMLWVYVMWTVLLLGAVVAAYLPALTAGVARRGHLPGWRFHLALEVLQLLASQRGGARAGLSLRELAHTLHVDGMELEQVIAGLTEIDWVGRLEDGRIVMLIDPAGTPVLPLAQRLLLPTPVGTGFDWQRGITPQSVLGEILRPANS